MERLLDTLAEIRQAKVFRFAGKKGLRVSIQLEELDAETRDLGRALGVVG